MHWLVLPASIVLILLVLVDGFETMILPRRIMHRFRYARFFYRTTWALWRVLASRLPAGKQRQALLGLFGPLSLLALFTTWVVGLVLGFALLHWSLPTPLQAPEGAPSLVTYLYLSGGTLFTLAYGDVTPLGPLGRFLVVLEGGVGFGFLAGIISYLPVLYQAFSRREVIISLLDARAGSPPSAAGVLVRLARTGELARIDAVLPEWERWSAELLESHLSYPVLAYYRSQHDNQSWLAALTIVLDTCALLLVRPKGHSCAQAQFTFAVARHAAVDLAMVFNIPPIGPPDRLPADQLDRLRQLLREAGHDLPEGPAVTAKLAELRGMYEPFVNGLAEHLLFALPAILPEKEQADNWQRSRWLPRAPGLGSLPMPADGEDVLG
jgi:hypothetical protein